MFDIDSESRTQPLPAIRHVAMTLCRKILKATLPALGLAFRKKNHCTIIHAVKQTEARCAISKEYAAQVAKIEHKARIAVNMTRVEDFV